MGEVFRRPDDADDACSADEVDDVVVCIAKASAMLFGPSSFTLDAFAT